ncbi:hypothetical protein BMS68_06085 [Leuconostoc mesenteroides subsp. cremoris]|nr:hypothetical protein BMS68_06085 [Leuconostoc mesenteroides subsp. cremoris]
MRQGWPCGIGAIVISVLYIPANACLVALNIEWLLKVVSGISLHPEEVAALLCVKVGLVE